MGTSMSHSNNDILLAISVPPFWHCGRTISGNSRIMLTALLPVVLMGVLYWGIPAARVIALAVFSAMVTEAFCQKLRNLPCTLHNGTAAITGLLLAFLLPASAPWWLVILGSVCAIGLGRMAFGGFGANPVCATLVGWALIFVSFPVQMDAGSALLHTEFLDPLLQLKVFGAESIADISSLNLLLGMQLGGLGASQSGLLLLAGIYLSARGVIRWEISISFLLGVILAATIIQRMDPLLYAGPMFHVCAGSTILSAFFLATEDSCCPHRPFPMFLYGMTGGVLVMLIRTFGVYTDGAPFAVMLINLLSPMFGLIPTRPFGSKGFGKEKK
jgi:electron transport complex protein RnfD